MPPGYGNEAIGVGIVGCGGRGLSLLEQAASLDAAGRERIQIRAAAEAGRVLAIGAPAVADGYLRACRDRIGAGAIVRVVDAALARSRP